MEALVYGVVITVVLAVVYSIICGIIDGITGKGQPPTQAEQDAIKLGFLSAIEDEMFGGKRK